MTILIRATAGYNDVMWKDLRAWMIKWHVRAKVFVICGASLVVCALAELTFPPNPHPDYRQATINVLLGMLLFGSGLYELCQLPKCER